jgi:hypothetical protein
MITGLPGRGGGGMGLNALKTKVLPSFENDCINKGVEVDFTFLTRNSVQFVRDMFGFQYLVYSYITILTFSTFCNDFTVIFVII